MSQHLRDLVMDISLVHTSRLQGLSCTARQCICSSRQTRVAAAHVNLDSSLRSASRGRILASPCPSQARKGWICPVLVRCSDSCCLWQTVVGEGAAHRLQAACRSDSLYLWRMVDVEVAPCPLIFSCRFASCCLWWVVSGVAATRCRHLPALAAAWKSLTRACVEMVTGTVACASIRAKTLSTSDMKLRDLQVDFPPIF